MGRHDLAIVPRFIVSRGNTLMLNVLSVAAGVLSLALLAQIVLPLPFSPVPITGQTFGVAMVALLLGRKRAISTLFVYLSLGAMGLPIFAAGAAGLLMGPTLGYLVGMLMASYVVGTLSDKGWCRGFFTAWLAATLGSVIIFISGLTVLSFFVPSGELMALGLIPFLPGDVIKNTLAAGIVSQSYKSLT